MEKTGNKDVILFIAKTKKRADRRKVEKEWNKTMPIYKGLEENFINDLFELETQDQDSKDYLNLFNHYNKAWKGLCGRNTRTGRHKYTAPNDIYFEAKYKPEEETYKPKTILGLLSRSITSKASKINFIEK